MRVIAVVLMMLGLLVLLAGGVRFTHRQEIARVGHTTVTAPAANVGTAPRLLGAAMLLAGAVLLARSARRRRA